MGFHQLSQEKIKEDSLAVADNSLKEKQGGIMCINYTDTIFLLTERKTAAIKPEMVFG